MAGVTHPTKSMTNITLRRNGSLAFGVNMDQGLPFRVSDPEIQCLSLNRP